MNDEAARRRAERGARAASHVEAQRRRDEQESAQAQVLVDRFVERATQAGVPTEELTARPWSGRGRYRTGVQGWYVRRDHSIGVSALGAALGHQVSSKVIAGLTALGIQPPSEGESRSIPDMSSLPAPVRQVFEHAFGEGTAHIFLIAAPVAAVALISVLFIKEVPLRVTLDRDDAPGPRVEEQPEQAPVTT